MLTVFTPSERKTSVYFERVFDDGSFNGFGFPCDEAGELLPEVPEAARANFAYCLEHPEKFVRFNKVIKRTHSYTENARGICECGNSVELWSQYMGACQCSKCGLWYNLFGQELLPPSDWEE